MQLKDSSILQNVTPRAHAAMVAAPLDRRTRQRRGGPAAGAAGGAGSTEKAEEAARRVCPRWWGEVTAAVNRHSPGWLGRGNGGREGGICACARACTCECECVCASARCVCVYMCVRHVGPVTWREVQREKELGHEIAFFFSQSA